EPSESTPQPTATPTSTPEPTATPTETATETPTETPTPDPYSKDYGLEEIGEALDRVDDAEVTLNIIPTEETEATESVVYDWNGELTVKMDVEEAIHERHHEHRQMEVKPMKTFIENVHDPEWRQKIHDQYIEQAGGENVLGLKEEMDWELYINGDNPHERFQESGLLDQWYKLSIASPRINGISSVHNGLIAATLQGTDNKHQDKHGKQTYIWDHEVSGKAIHGVYALIEEPARTEDEMDQQQNYIGETHYARQQLIASVADSNYLKPDDSGGVAERYSHPAEQDFDGEELGMYLRLCISAGDADIVEAIKEGTSDELVDEFVNEYFPDDDASYAPAHDYIDRVVTAARIAEVNDGIEVDHSKDSITVRSG
ncbi:MAG: hypothetical protein ABEJ72_04335, partial [Candidatus Aenigmatarchaeota archaeon]